MHGVVSLLPEPFYGQVEALWDDLANNFGLRGIRMTPYPHFSWQIGEDYPFDRLEAALGELAGSLPPFEARTTGLGIFTGEQPVLFVQVVRSPEVAAVHEKVWKALQPVGTGISPYYGPDFWMPHISLAYLDLTPENTGPVLKKLAFRSYNWCMRMDNVAFIYEPQGSIGTLKYRFELRGV